LVLQPRPSRLLLCWWLALHALLIGATALVGAGWWLKVLAVLAVAAHGLARRPVATPSPILLAADGSCHVPTLDPAWLEPGPRTRLNAYWLRLSLVGGAARRDILLCVDQVDAASWARLNARLRGRRAAGTAA
jgi:hypothetical protein